MEISVSTSSMSSAVLIKQACKLTDPLTDRGNLPHLKKISETLPLKNKPPSSEDCPNCTHQFFVRTHLYTSSTSSSSLDDDHDQIRWLLGKSSEKWSYYEADDGKPWRWCHRARANERGSWDRCKDQPRPEMIIIIIIIIIINIISLS